MKKDTNDLYILYLNLASMNEYCLLGVMTVKLLKNNPANLLISPAIAQNALFEGQKVSQLFILLSLKVVHGIMVQRLSI